MLEAATPALAIAAAFMKPRREALLLLFISSLSYTHSDAVPIPPSE